MLKHQIYNLKLRSVGRRIVTACGNPVLVIGMHRSGTSLLTRILRQAGGYYGSVLEPNSEPPSFIKLNDRLLESFGLDWYSVPKENFIDTRGHIIAAKQILQNLEYLWDEFFQHFGDPGVEFRRQVGNDPIDDNNGILLLGKSLPRLNNKGTPFWGWKDPRTTLTLPIWLRLFPDAKIVHLIRNGIDSSLSLWRRCKVNGNGAPFCEDAANCFKLWERYVAEGISWRKDTRDQYYELRYEDLLNAPDEEVKKLFSVLGLTTSKEIHLDDMIDKNKILDYKHWEKYPEFVDCASTSRLFEDLGYSSLLPYY